MTKPEALKLIDAYIENKSLKTHCLCVGTSMKWYARKFGEDEEFWEVTGILHDLDWEKYPDIHPDKCVELLQEMGEHVDMINAIIAHKHNEKIQTLIDKCLFACDELSGFVYACILVRPDKSIDNLEVASVKKKIKDKAFAKAVSREDIHKGAEILGISLDEHIQNVIDAFRANKENLGLV